MQSNVDKSKSLPNTRTARLTWSYLIDDYIN